MCAAPLRVTWLKGRQTQKETAEVELCVYRAQDRASLVSRVHSLQATLKRKSWNEGRRKEE